ncbi:MAG: GTPase HflX [Candidatus Babeliales bacterium]
MVRIAEQVSPYSTTLLVGVHAPYNRTPDIGAYYEEFLHLVRTLGVPYEDVLYIKLREVDSATFFTKGKLEEILQKVEELGIEQIIISEPLNALQERNIADILDVDVIDRTRLILDIFEQSAITAEGKTQVEVARLKHEKSRLAGKGHELEQQKGNIGVRSGAGETLKERQARLIDKRILKLKEELIKIQTTRATQRKRRIENRVPQLCLIGYTNAGKSSLLNSLTKSDVLSEDKLFATLDTTTRTLNINGIEVGVISDTVGFIQMLPPQLIDAFKSTLSELEHADLLLHVIDLSDPLWQSHAEIVHNILRDLEIDKETLYVFNKADKVEMTDELHAQLFSYQPHVISSTLTKEGLKPLRDALLKWHAH